MSVGEIASKFTIRSMGGLLTSFFVIWKAQILTH